MKAAAALSAKAEAVVVPSSSKVEIETVTDEELKAFVAGHTFDVEDMITACGRLFEGEAP